MLWFCQESALTGRIRFLSLPMRFRLPLSVCEELLKKVRQVNIYEKSLKNKKFKIIGYLLFTLFLCSYVSAFNSGFTRKSESD